MSSMRLSPCSASVVSLVSGESIWLKRSLSRSCIISPTCIWELLSDCLSSISDVTLHSSLLIADRISLPSPGTSSEEERSGRSVSIMVMFSLK
uniref:Putative secreted protein n=1 Tax=Anopheles darlingi TaxID=43151 RepID=A0A2M4DHE0_ANODA